MDFQETDAPVLFVFGQSNAHGNGARLPEAEKITEPLANVFGLHRRYNQAYGLKDVVWSGFVTEGMNLGETQDHTYCLAESFAKIWQKKTDEGWKLPPLYIVQISIGAMGIAEHERNGWNMWWRNRTPVMIPGEGGVANISLYPLAIEIMTLVMKNLKNSGKTPRILGLHWNQWETEADTGGDSIVKAEENYRELFEKLVRSEEDYHMTDLTESPYWKPERQDKGIFQEDMVHYSGQVQRYFAELMAEEIFGENG